MRKLVIGIAVVALLGLLGMPAMAVLDTAEVLVSIEVLSYGAISFSPEPDATLSLEVGGPVTADPFIEYRGLLQFNVLANTACALKLSVDHVTEALFDPGAGYWYPTATGQLGDDAYGHFIGYGVALRTMPGTFVAWPSYATEAGALGGGITISYTADEANTKDYNAEIKVNSYTDSAKGGDVLAPKGTYEGTLTLTLSAA